MSTYQVAVSDTRTDLPADAYTSDPDFWAYEFEAEGADAAVPIALERWRAEVGDRVPVSIASRLIS